MSGFRNVIKVKKLYPHAMLPTRGSDNAAGYDLYAAFDKVGDSIVLYPGQRRAIKTGIAVALTWEELRGDEHSEGVVTSGYYLRVAPRSGLAVKQGIDVLAGVVDLDYRGEVMVALLNTGDQPVTINQGDRIAQLIVESIANPEVDETWDELPTTARGSDGFGSTGR